MNEPLDPPVEPDVAPEAASAAPRVVLPGLVDESDVDQAITWLNSQHALVFDGSKCLVWSFIHDAIHERSEWRQSPTGDFKTWYAAYLVPDGKRRTPLGDYWLIHPEARRYREVVFDPSGRARTGVLNLWRGYAIPPAPGAWPRLKEHLYEVVADGNDVVFEYVLNWMACMIQKPYQPAGTAIVLRGRQRAGKGILVRSLGRCLGEHFVHLTHAGQLTNRFNSVLADALLVFADEIMWAGERSAEGTLKGLITEPTLSIERKGREIAQIRNYVHLMMASNFDWVAPVGIGDKRFVVMDVAPKHVGDTSYFEAIADEQTNGGGSAMLYELLRHDISAYRPEAIPHTKARREQVTQSFDPFMKWWYDALSDGELAGTAWTALGVTVERAAVYTAYLDRMARWHVPYPLTQVWLGRQLTQVCPEMKGVQHHGGRRSNVFPSLSTCRMRFEAHIGCELAWPPEDD